MIHFEHSPRVDEIRAYLDRHVELAPGTKIQYGHPSPRFWEDWEGDQDGWEARRSERSLALYLHIPFCPPTDPPACGFCLFSREDFSGYPLIQKYVDYLEREIDTVGPRFGGVELGSLYFGGGTPNLLKPEEIRRLFAAVKRHFRIGPETEVTFEGYPSLFTRDRLEALLECGVTRISVGAQQLDPVLVAYSGRKQEASQVEAVVRFAKQNGIRCNVDLITGWFDQTAEHVIEDVETLAEWGASGIVNHPLTLAGDSPFGRRREELPDNRQMCETFLAARERMLALGYRSDSYTDYSRDEYPVVRYLEMYRRILDTDRLGLGAAANSVLAGDREAPGVTFVNASSTGEYYARLDEGKGATVSGFSFAEHDLQLLYVLKGLEGAPWLTAGDYRARFDGDLRTDWMPWWEALEERGWLEWVGDDPRLKGDGVFFTAMVQRALSEPRNAQLRRESELSPTVS